MKTTRIHRRRDDQWKRYQSRFGEIASSRRMARAAFIPRHTPHISIAITRDEAAAGLREWRSSSNENDWQDDPDHSGCIVQTIPQMPNEFGWGCRPKLKEGEEWKAMPLGDTGAEIYAFDDDTVFD